MFTVLPLPSKGTSPSLSPAGAARTIRWLPLIGALLGGLAGLLAAAVLARIPAGAGLAAVVGVLALAALSGGLHLDGLADTGDGLASRAPSAQALEIMRRSDIGPFGVLAVTGVLLLDVTALSVVMGGHTLWRAPAALAVGAMTARLAAVHACRPQVPAARADGFGSLVTGTVSIPGAIGLTALTLGAGALLAAVCGANVVGWVLAQIVAMTTAAALQAGLIRRLGGITGDVYGALIEMSLTVTLIGLALS